MKIRNSIFMVVVLLTVLGSIWAFRPVPAKYNYMNVTVVESIIPGGLGRSRMIITMSSGNAVEADIENLYSMVGINFGNISKNDKKIIEKINSLQQDGWELHHITAGVQSPGGADAQNGIFLTRYLFRKEQ